MKIWIMRNINNQICVFMNKLLVTFLLQEKKVVMKKKIPFPTSTAPRLKNQFLLACYWPYWWGSTVFFLTRVVVNVDEIH